MPKPKAKPAQVANDWRPKFLEALAATGNVRFACKAAGIGRTTAYRGKEADPAFGEQWDDACDDAADVLELEARRRATQGVERTRYVRVGKNPKTGLIDYQKVVEREYSDTLLMFLLRGIRPEVYVPSYDIDKVVAAFMRAQPAAPVVPATQPAAAFETTREQEALGRGRRTDD